MSPYEPRPAQCGSGWRVVRNVQGRLYEAVGPSGRPRHFRTFDGATRAAHRLNAARAATRRGTGDPIAPPTPDAPPEGKKPVDGLLRAGR